MNIDLLNYKPNRLVDPDSWLDNIPFAYSLLDTLKPRVLVELGTFSGNSFVTFNDASERLNFDSKMFAVDTWEGDGHTGPYATSIYDDLSLFIRKNYPTSSLLRMRFDEALDLFEDRSIDLLHIDGLHTYSAVKHDFLTWKPKLSSRSVVLFHDTMVKERDFGVWKFWDELKEDYLTFNLTFANGLGVLVFGNESQETNDLIRKLQENEFLV